MDVGRTPAFALRRNSEFTALWSGQAVSSLGASISSLAYPLLALDLTGSTALAGVLAGALSATTFLLRLPAALVADRVDRRRLMMCCDVGRCLALASVAVAYFAGGLHFAHVLVVAIVEGTLGVLFAPAEAAAVRRVVAPDQVGEAVARNQARSQLAGLLGPAVGGLLYAWSRGLPFVADAASYLVSLVTVASLQTPLSERSHRPQSGPRRHLRAEVVEGLVWLWRDRFLRAVSLCLSGGGLAFTSLGLVTLVLAREQGAGPATIGVMFALTGAGGLVGALAAPRLLARPRPGRLVIAFGWVSGAAALALLAAPSPVVLGLLGGLAFLLVPAVNAVVFARVAQRAPDAVQGRASSAATQLTTLLQPVGPVLAGVLLEVAGSTKTVVFYAAILLALALAATASRSIRGEP